MIDDEKLGKFVRARRTAHGPKISRLESIY